MIRIHHSSHTTVQSKAFMILVDVSDCDKVTSFFTHYSSIQSIHDSGNVSDCDKDTSFFTHYSSVQSIHDSGTRE